MNLPAARPSGSEMRICVAGASGYAGSACSDVFVAEGWRVSGFSRRGGTTPGGMQVTACADRNGFQELLRQTKPDVLLVASGIADLDTCERDPTLSLQSNVGTLVEWISDIRSVCPSVLVVLLSSIYVFGDHCPPEGFCETDAPRPLSVYGSHKLQAEHVLQAAGVRHLIVRLPWLIGSATHSADPIWKLWSRVLQGEYVVDDGLRFPTDVHWVGQSISSLILIGAEGIVHLSASESGSRFELISSMLNNCSPARDTTPLSRLSASDLPAYCRAPRPKYLKLRSCRPEVLELLACPSWLQIAEQYAACLCTSTDTLMGL